MLNREWELWLERSWRAFVDFVAVQFAAAATLLVFAWQASGELHPVRDLFQAYFSGYYLHTFLPLSLLFPLTYSLAGLYTRLRGYMINHKLRLAAISAGIATLLLAFVSRLLVRPVMPPIAFILFGLLAIAAAAGVRWLNDVLFYRDARGRSITPDPALMPSHDDKVLVVGGAGYIGSIVLFKLLRLGYSVRLLDNLLYGDQTIQPLFRHPRFEFVHGDCRNIQDVVRAMAGVKNVIHLAAIVGDPACAEDYKNALEINYAATRMMIEVAKGHDVERFIFASSCSVYGASDKVISDEHSATEPISLYAETKLNSEKVLLDAKSRSFHPVVLRFATVFGLAPRPRFDLIVNLLTAKAVRDGVITIFNGNQWRPFIHVEDVAEAVVQSFLAPIEAVSGEIFNVGDDRLNMTLTDLADKIQKLIPATRVENIENQDRRSYRVSFEKIRACLGFRAQYTVEDGIEQVRKALESGQIENYRHPFYSNLLFLKERGPADAKQELDVKIMEAFATTNPEAKQGDAPVKSQGSLSELSPVPGKSRSARI